MTRRAATEVLGIGRSVLMRWIAAGKLHPEKDERGWYNFSEADLERCRLLYVESFEALPRNFREPRKRKAGLA